MQQIEITEKLYVSADGMLCFQSPDGCCPRILSHQHRTRVNNSEITIFIQAITGMDQQELVSMCIEMGIEWLGRYVTNDEGDIYRLLSKPEVMGWWKHHWYTRNEGMRFVLAEWYEDVVCMSTEAGYIPAECKKRAQTATLEKYGKLHRLAFNRQSYQFRHLEDSYAKIW